MAHLEETSGELQQLIKILSLRLSGWFPKQADNLELDRTRPYDAGIFLFSMLHVLAIAAASTIQSSVALAQEHPTENMRGVNVPRVLLYEHLARLQHALQELGAEDPTTAPAMQDLAVQLEPLLKTLAPPSNQGGA